MPVEPAQDLDPFLIEIIKDSLIAIGDEMFIALGRTSQSPIIYEVLDFASGLTDRDGQLITQGNGVTGFIGTLTAAVLSVLEKFGVDGLKPGDVLMTNDPYGGGGTHLSDVTLVVPIYYGGELVAFSASKAHWTELGGKDPGSWTTDSTEIFQEGLQLPCVKVWEAETPVQGVIDILETNVRLPAMTLGDMHAQAAALRLGEQRFHELCDKHGVAAVLGSMNALLDHGEKLARHALAGLPKGTFEADDMIDDDGIGHGPFPVQVKVTITDDEFVADFTGSHPQVPGPVNCTETGLNSVVRALFLAITDPSMTINDGCFRPVRIVCPPATIFTAQRPSPVSAYWETANYASDLIWKALAPSLPERLSAGHFLSVCGSVFAGTHPDTGELFLCAEAATGGWGAGVAKDGEQGLMCVSDGETYVIPVEVAEARYGFMLDEFALDTAPAAGAGRHRGGRGCVRSYRVTSEELFVTVTCGRHKYPPWGTAGGAVGSPNQIRFTHNDGRVVTMGKSARYRLERGEVVSIVTGTGGGWGDPHARPVEDVVADVANGYISAEQADLAYGVVIDPVTLDVAEVRRTPS
ncbi:MAG TPA: hydantoinase B/oxoprolinase family protein [Conexibacter sp.]|nr:hydantoinase B/oxoprolinase family protein [Conexibacter sp.]